MVAYYLSTQEASGSVLFIYYCMAAVAAMMRVLPETVLQLPEHKWTRGPENRPAMQMVYFSKGNVARVKS